MLNNFLNCNSVGIFNCKSNTTHFCTLLKDTGIEIPEVFYFQEDDECRMTLPYYHTLKHAISMGWKYVTVFHCDYVPDKRCMDMYKKQFDTLPADWDVVCYTRNGDCSKYNSYDEFVSSNGDYMNCSNNSSVSEHFMTIPNNVFGEFGVFTVKTSVLPLLIESLYHVNTNKGYNPGLGTYKRYFTKDLYFIKYDVKRGLVYPLNYDNDKVNSGMSSEFRDEDKWMLCPKTFQYQ